MGEKQESSWLSGALYLVGAVLVAYLIWSLAAENRELKARIAELQQGPPADGLQAGEPMPEVALASLAGESETMTGLVGEGGVAVFLTTTCPYCKQTLPTWNELYASYAERGVPFIGISFHDSVATSEYAEAEGVEFPLWVLADPADAPAVRVPSVPFTAIVGPDGSVVRAWLGPLDEAAVTSLQDVLDEELSGSGRLLSGSLERDPDCCAAAAPGTGAAS